MIELDLTRITNLSVRILQALIVRAGFDPLTLLDQSVEVNCILNSAFQINWNLII